MEIMDFPTPVIEKKANHRANVVRVGAILPHPNADKLEITHVDGYQIVIGKGSMKTGELAVYIQPDSVVPQTTPFMFLWQGQPVPEGDPIGLVPEKYRRITVRRFRGEYSEGLLLPIEDFFSELNDPLPEGTDISSLIGVTHYVPEFDREDTHASTVGLLNSPRRKYPKTAKGWFFFILFKLGFKKAQRSLALETGFNYPEYDVDALKNAGRRGFKDGELVQATEKIHGSNGRYVCVDGVMYAGSRKQWKQEGSNVWWNVLKQYPEIEFWCRQNPNKVLYGEVGPTQKGYNYGCEKGETFFFAYDVFDPKTNTWSWPGNEGFELLAPPLYSGPYIDSVMALADGNSVVPGATGIREGIVISSRERRTKLKVVSNAFLEKESKR
jgi:hypothetical protein